MITSLRHTRALRGVSLLLLFFSYEAMAWDSCRVVFSSSFPGSQTEELGGCQTCHTTAGGGPFNAYGQDLLANGASGAGSNCDQVNFPQALIDVNNLDSDGEGNSNEVEIAASTQPGWCDTGVNPSCVNPAGTPPGVALDPAPAGDLAPVARPGGPYSGQPGTAIVFDGSASSDPNGDALTYFWDFGDGAMGDGVSPSHVYAAEAVYTVSLTVNDGVFDSSIATSTVVISNSAVQSDGKVLYDGLCLGCHGDPWNGSAVDDNLPGLRRVAGSRSCNITASIFGNSVFPNGVTVMQHLQGLTEIEIGAMADYLNSLDTSGERRYVATCAGCHGNDGSGGRVGEDVQGDSASETREAIAEESEMRYLACMPSTDIDLISDYLRSLDAHDDNEDHESGGGSPGPYGLVLLALFALRQCLRRGTIMSM